MVEIFLGSACIFGLLLMVLGWHTFYQVEEGHCAVVTRFGKLHSDQSGQPIIVKPGLHTKLPWEKLHTFSIMERSMALREKMREVELLARDGTLLRFSPQVRFQFQPQQCAVYLFGMQHPITHLREVFRSLLSTEVARFGSIDAPEGSYAEIRRDYAQLNERFKQKFLESRLEEKYGIKLYAIEISEILPPADLAQALNSVQKIEAENKALISRCDAECAQRLAVAKHAVSIATLKAEAAETEITILGNTMRELLKMGTLHAYLKRRRHEVTAQSKTLYFNA